MPVRIRLSRGGAKKRPFYRIVVADSRRSRDGKFIEQIGTYNPMLNKDNPERVKLNADKAKEWIGKGAQPSDRVKIFLSNLGIVEKLIITEKTKQHLPKKKTQEKLKNAKKAEEVTAAKTEKEEVKSSAEENNLQNTPDENVPTKVESSTDSVSEQEQNTEVAPIPQLPESKSDNVTGTESDKQSDTKKNEEDKSSG